MGLVYSIFLLFFTSIFFTNFAQQETSFPKISSLLWQTDFWKWGFLACQISKKRIDGEKSSQGDKPGPKCNFEYNILWRSLQTMYIAWPSSFSVFRTRNFSIISAWIIILLNFSFFQIHMNGIITCMRLENRNINWNRCLSMSTDYVWPPYFLINH